MYPQANYGPAPFVSGAPPVGGAPPVQGNAVPPLPAAYGGGGAPPAVPAGGMGMMGGLRAMGAAMNPALMGSVAPALASVYGGSLPPPRTVGGNGFGVRPDVSHDELVDYLLPKFRAAESSGNYQAQRKDYDREKNMNTASGAYGYTDSTWNNYKGFPRAKDAPPEIQDERMRADLMHSIARFGGDPFKAVANHFYPARASNPASWSQPVSSNPDAMTVADYLSKVLPPNRVQTYLASAKGASS
jgi:hypothetical protein